MLCLTKVAPSGVRFPSFGTTEPQVPLFSEAARKKMVVLKIHSHPSGFPRFSGLDNKADRALLGSLLKLAPNEIGHASAVMLPEGKIFARLVGGDGRFLKISRVVVVGDEVVSFEDGRSTKGAPLDEAFLADAAGIRRQDGFDALEDACRRRWLFRHGKLGRRNAVSPWCWRNRAR